MKQVLLAGMTVLALAASVSVAEAEPITFGYTGSLVTFTVPSTGIYQILAFGAQGGITPGAQTGIGTNPDSGARGAEIVGDFSLTVGDLLQIAVGGAGMPGSGTEGGGGGGGTFVVGPDHAPLVIAGGGGGSGYFFGLPDTPSSVISGQGGLIGPNGGNQSQPGTGTGGNGGSGSGGQLSGGGGGGFFSAGRGPTGGDGFPDLTEGLGKV